MLIVLRSGLPLDGKLCRELLLVWHEEWSDNGHRASPNFIIIFNSEEVWSDDESHRESPDVVFFLIIGRSSFLLVAGNI